MLGNSRIRHPLDRYRSFYYSTGGQTRLLRYIVVQRTFMQLLIEARAHYCSSVLLRLFSSSSWGRYHGTCTVPLGLAFERQEEQPSGPPLAQKFMYEGVPFLRLQLYVCRYVRRLAPHSRAYSTWTMVQARYCFCGDSEPRRRIFKAAGPALLGLWGVPFFQRLYF